VFDSFLFTGYQNKSEAIVHAEHPTWNQSQVAAQAAVEFDAGARRFFEATIGQMRAIRPKARLGFYGTPFKAWGTWWNATGNFSSATPSASNPRPLASANCMSAHINERWCYLSNETSGHLIKTVGPPYPHYLSGCCALCNTTAGCRAWSYNSGDGFSCSLFDRLGSEMRASEVYKCVIGDCIKTGPPPPPPPGPSPPTPHKLTPDQIAALSIRAHNDKLQWLWNQVDVLMPELYMPKLWGADYIRGMLREAERLVTAAHANGNTKLAIVPCRHTRDSSRTLRPHHRIHMRPASHPWP
jgi:hypothetical protein